MSTGEKAEARIKIFIELVEGEPVQVRINSKAPLTALMQRDITLALHREALRHVQKLRRAAPIPPVTPAGADAPGMTEVVNVS